MKAHQAGNAVGTVRVAAAHVAPVYHDTDKTIGKACSIIAEASSKGVQLVAFPEAFIPGFPVWANIVAPTHTHEFFAQLVANSIRLHGPEIARIRAAAKQNNIMVSVGFNESTPASVGCLWNSNVLIGAGGEILNAHRKLVPTYYEKLVWAPGDGAGLRVVDTAIGKIGMLICGENTNPLARYSLIAQGEQLHISSYPPVAASRPRGSGGDFDMESAIHIRAAAHSIEGKVYNLVTSTFYDDTLRNAMLPLGKELVEWMDESPKSVSMIIGPNGKIIGDTLSDEEGLCIADIDYAPIVELKRLHDLSGHYNRFDIFRLEVDRTRLDPIHFTAARSSGTEESGLPSRLSDADTPEQDALG